MFLVHENSHTHEEGECLCEMQCSICLETVEEGTGHAHTLECQHTFHASCLIGWMRRGNLSCPMCRNNLEENWDNAIIPRMALNERASYVRRMSRRANAPADLKRMVARVQRAEQTARELRKERMDTMRTHREELRAVRKARNKVWTAERRVRTLMRSLGLYNSHAIPLPPLALHRNI